MKILYVINKMNYLSEKSEHDIYLLTYEQPNQTLSFQISEKIAYYPINAPIPQREGLTLWG